MVDLERDGDTEPSFAHGFTDGGLELQLNSALDCRLLNPDDIVDSPLAIRRGFHQEASFRELCESIERRGGNVSPVMVRPAEGDKFEIVFGHRRVAACRQLGFHVLAIVRLAADGDELLRDMEYENQARHAASAYDRGVWYQRLLKERRFESQAELAQELNVSKSDLSNMLTLANLDKRIISAFRSPSELQTRYAKKLRDAWTNQRDDMLARIKHIEGLRRSNRDLSPAEVFSLLTGQQGAKAEGVEVDEGAAYSTRWRTRFHADGGQCSSVMADSVPR